MSIVNFTVITKFVAKVNCECVLTTLFTLHRADTSAALATSKSKLLDFRVQLKTIISVYELP